MCKNVCGMCVTFLCDQHWAILSQYTVFAKYQILGPPLLIRIYNTNFPLSIEQILWKNNFFLSFSGPTFYEWFSSMLIWSLLRPEMAIQWRVTFVCIWKIYFWKNYKIFITQPILVRFWILRYLWKHLCKRILDFRLSHTSTHSFSHFQTIFT